MGPPVREVSARKVLAFRTRMCPRKARFATRDEANGARLTAVLHGKRGLIVYRCGEHFHLGRASDAR